MASAHLGDDIINRSMGQPDLCPFVLSPHVIDKLGYIGALIHGA
ncbi:MAG TPA: putative zinc-binding metallopeptidase [Methylocella sp.]